MNLLSKLGLCAMSAGLASIVGCSKAHEPEPATARNQSAPLSAPDNLTPASRTRSAAEQIAQSRCEREQGCGNIGKDETYSTSQDCLARVQSDWKDDLNARQCPGGINQRQLDECLTHVRDEACANPFDALARITECTAAQICIEQP